EQERYFETAYEFLAERYGEKNLIYASVHLDEKTPHMHVGFVPVTEDGRLSAKDFFGQKKQLVSLQDDFNAYLKENDFDLERGVSTSRKHVETAKYKALTFHNLEQEAKEKYEQTMNRIEAIDDNTKSIENIEAKKVLGLVGMKEQDYKTLIDYASNGALYKFQVEDLQAELKKTKEEVAELKVEMQLGQDSIRYYYRDIEKNFDKLVDKKVSDEFKKHDVVE
ncbi:plasmid recombination protein, partial [Burkholderia multivorans]|uniref:MobV family relaxase n=1 Tax=Burkholderia multivorans TaxID=87883 RepID=UPI000DAFD14F